jgi:hypothetical protein
VNSLIGAIVGVVVGGGLAAATVFGVVSSQTATPASVNEQVVDYGATG